MPALRLSLVYHCQSISSSVRALALASDAFFSASFSLVMLMIGVFSTVFIIIQIIYLVDEFVIRIDFDFIKTFSFLFIDFKIATLTCFCQQKKNNVLTKSRCFLNENKK